jgi:hypothetical protein
VKRYDDVLCAEREEYERIAKENCDSSHCVNNFNDPPSCCVPNNSNTSSAPTSYAPSASVAAAIADVFQKKKKC